MALKENLSQNMLHGAGYANAGKTIKGITEVGTPVPRTSTAPSTYPIVGGTPKKTTTTTKSTTPTGTTKKATPTTTKSTTPTGTTKKVEPVKANDKKKDKDKKDKKDKKDTTVPETSAPSTVGPIIDGPVPGGSNVSTGDINSYLQGYLGNISSPSFDYDQLEGVTVKDPRLMSAAELAALYGLNYNYDDIYNTLLQGVNKGFDVRYEDQGIAEGNYYRNAATAQNTLAQTLANQQSQAVQSGMNRGMQAANLLSSALGLSQTFSDEATALAQERAGLSGEYSAALANTDIAALDTYNTMGQQLGDLSKSIYSSDSSNYAAQLGYNSEVNTANSAMAAQKMAAQSEYSAQLNNAISNIMNQYYSGQISLEEADIAAQAQIESAKSYGVDAAGINAAASMYNSDKNHDASVYNADKNHDASVYSADKNSAASKYAADKNAAAYSTGVGAGAPLAATTDTEAHPGSATVDMLHREVVAGRMTQKEYDQTLDAYLKQGIITKQDVAAYGIANKNAPGTVGYYSNLFGVDTPTSKLK